MGDTLLNQYLRPLLDSNPSQVEGSVLVDVLDDREKGRRIVWWVTRIS